MAIELKQHDHGGHSHTHDHDHAHDHGDENLENLFAIGICGSFSVVAIILGGMSVVMQRKGMLPPGDPAHLQALLTSAINVLVAQGAMWDRTYGRPLHDREALYAAARLTLDRLIISA